MNVEKDADRLTIEKWQTACDAMMGRSGELDRIDAIDYCSDDGKITVVGMDGVRSSIWRTDDREMYYEVGAPPRKKRITAFMAIDPVRWLVGYEDGEMWDTDDGGRSWERREYLIVRELQE